ncbi:MAG: pyridoxamine 5'-phosphate oxidase family protein [Hyphomicrobiaceae bacterium]
MPNQRNTLDEIEKWCWSQLLRATRHRRSDFRWMNLATVDNTGTPTTRTVVLREVDKPKRSVAFYTDARSEKISELKAKNAVGLHFQSDRHSTQMRMTGTASFATEERRLMAWEGLHPGAKASYAQPISPGSPILPPAQRSSDTPVEIGQGYRNFTVVDVSITRIDWLELHRDGHRRALFARGPHGQLQSTWLAP